jgi:hypothetical protein
LILKDLTSLWPPANPDEGGSIPERRCVTLRGDFYTEIAESAEITEAAGCRTSVGIGLTGKKKDGGLKAAATDSEKQKEITGIACRGI